MRREHEAGFTLVELLVVIAIVGILVGAALPLYLGYQRDARLAEAKALGSSALTALSACVQVKGGNSNCVVSEIRDRVGLDGSNATYDGRWVVGVAQLSVDGGTPPTLSGTITVQGVIGKNTEAMALAVFANASGVTLRCNSDTATVPATSTSNDAC